MVEDAKLKLELRIVPSEGEPNPVLFDDIFRLIRQGLVTAPKDVPQVQAAGEFHRPADNSLNSLEARIKHRIEQVSADSRAVVEKRAETASQPDGAAKLETESLEAARRVVAAVHRAIVRGIIVDVS